MKKLYILLLLLFSTSAITMAQRKTDPLDRGVVAIKTTSGVFISWRIQADEYYDVKYNLYRDGSLIAENLNVSNYSDTSGSATSKYTVKAVKNGIEGNASKTASVWATQDGNKNPYLSIQMQDVVARDGNVVFCTCGNHTPSVEIAQNYSLNDCSVADLDGDGEMEIIVKRINETDASDVYPDELDTRYTFDTSSFHIWSRADSRGTDQGTVTCAWNLNVSTDLVYGDGTNNYYYANLAECNKLYVTTTSGEPYLIFNMGGNSLNKTAESSVVNGDGTTTYIVDVKAVRSKKGYAHLNAIKGANDQSITVTKIEYTKPKPFYPKSNTTAFNVIEAYKLNGTRLWWIDCGPNMVSLNSTETNAVAYDWDKDGKAEVLLRGADNMIVHKSDGTTYTIGSSTVNTRDDFSHLDSQYAWTHTGAEYLIYLNGETATSYQVVDYPLPRFESDESGKTEQQVWSPLDTNGGYGHRSSKYFFGAPFLDGRNASIFLARGIYTQIKMIALDVNPSSHSFTTRWTWKCNDTSSSWFGQGNHNMNIADVDGDGCDEIVYGSMVIDNNGKGLSTTGLGHGDALHTGDLDPFTKGMEVFACNEDHPGSNFRNATTSEIYYRMNASKDDGRAMAGNFSNDYPGCLAASASSPVISTSTHDAINELTNGCFNKPWTPMSLNGRIYWDGDLLEEAFDSPGTAKDAVVSKNGTRILETYGCNLTNDSKNNPCAQGDIIGDWREELVLRNSANTELRIYTTPTPTTYRIPSLWYDPEYRQAMVWQVCAYNQPPHVSYFMGEMEELTKVPVPLTMEGRTEITTDGDVVPTSANGSAVIAYGKSKVGIPSEGAVPSQLIIDVPSTVSGNEGNGINYSYSTTQLGVDSNKGDLTGNMHLVKQGDGLLKLTNRTFSYTGNTDVYAGSVYFRGTLNSPVWMNRHTTLYTGGTYNSSVTMEYGSTLYITNDNSKADGTAPTAEYATANINTLNLHEGSRVVFDITASGSTDVLNMQTLSIRKQNWTYGPQYLAPVFQFNITGTLTTKRYPLGTLSNIDGDLSDIIIEGDFGRGIEISLTFEDGTLYLDAVDNGENYIGNEDCTTDFFGDFSDSYTIEPGYNYNFKFTNYGNSAETWYNWVLALANGSGHSTTDRADYSEYLILRADNYGWKDAYDESGLSNNFNWDTFKNDMTEATVNMDVQFKDGIFTMNSTFSCKNGKTYNYSYTSKEISADNVTMFFTVDHSFMTYPIVIVKEIEPENIIGESGIISATLVHTASTYCDTDNTQVTGTVDQEKEFYHVQGSQTWQGYAFAEFSYNIPDGATITSATLTWNAINSSNSGDRNNDVYYLNEGVTLDYDVISSSSPVLLRYNNQKTYISSVNWVKGTSTSAIQTIETDVTDAISAMTSNGVIIFEWTNNAGGATLFGKGSSSYAPTLSISYVIPSSLTLQPKQVDDYESGIYNTVTLNRNFKAGYSTLCVPFNTTVSEFTSNDESAYVAYLSGAELADGFTTLVFTNGTEIKANQPYIIYLSKALNAPSFTEKPVFAENAKTITVGNWSMTGNYEVGKNMEGFYGVANNASILKGGSGSTLNGFTAYITGSANGAKIRFSNGDETTIENINAQTTTSVTAIYTVNGIRIAQPQKGINILRMSDGSTRKIYK